MALAGALADRDALRSCRLLGAAARLRDETGASFDPDERTVHDELVGSLRGAAGAVAFEQAFADGEELSFDDAVALASAADLVRERA